MSSKLFVRYSDASDEQAIFDYYADNRHAYVFRRDPEVWRERISNGAVTMIHDAEGRIVASSISYPVIVKNEAGEDVHKWTEIGSVNVALKEAGLFAPLISAQIMRAYFLEPPDDRFVAEIVAANAHSQHVFMKEGALQLYVPEDLQKKIFETIKPEDQDPNARWYHFGVECIPYFAARLNDFAKNPVLTSKGGEMVYELDFSRCVVVKNFGPELEKIAGADCGDRTAPDMGKSIKAFRQSFTL